MSQPLKARSIVLAGSTATLTVFGAWYGASLKENQEIKKKEKARREATPADKLAVLEETKSRLVAKKTVLEDKIKQLEDRANKRRDAPQVKGRHLPGT
ncbi:hypothetical protein ACLMJK_001041 [Lecanora helva]